MKNRVGILIIGDEILSGRVRDIHIPYLTKCLATRGMDVCEVRVVGDNQDVIVKALQDLHVTYDWVFTTGGIGTTHDDMTIAAVAKTVQKPLVENQEIKRILHERYPASLNAFHPFGHAFIPEGAELLDNPVSYVPSFYIDNIYVLPGMPHVMQGIVAALLPKLPEWQLMSSISVKSLLDEVSLGQALYDVQKQFPAVLIGSYPYVKDDGALGTVLVARSRDKNMLKHVEKLLCVVGCAEHESMG